MFADQLRGMRRAFKLGSLRCRRHTDLASVASSMLPSSSIECVLACEFAGYASAAVFNCSSVTALALKSSPTVGLTPAISVLRFCAGGADGGVRCPRRQIYQRKQWDLAGRSRRNGELHLRYNPLNKARANGSGGVRSGRQASGCCVGSAARHLVYGLVGNTTIFATARPAAQQPKLDCRCSALRVQ